MNPAGWGPSGCDAEEVKRAIERFLKNSTRPALLEPGEPFLHLVEGSYSVESRHSRCVLQAWDEHRNLVRRVIRVRQDSRGKLTLVVEKFARREGELVLLDLARPQTQEWRRRESRMVSRERFRQFLTREFPDWKLAEISSEPNLEHTFSPSYPRALLTRGQSAMAAIGAGTEVEDCSGLLSFGLIWLDYLRRRNARMTVEGLVLWMPQGMEKTTRSRLPFLNNTLARFELFLYGEEDYAIKLDPHDYGNVETHLERCPPGNVSAASALDNIPGFAGIVKADGTTSLRVNGLEFGRNSAYSQLETHARELARFRRPDAEDKLNPLYTQSTEAWLEACVRRDLEAIDATLCPSPVYGQVPALAAAERGIIDLLAVDRAGRLTVVELKATADIHLPLQALDYWMRVKWHVDTREFSRFGYFPGTQLGSQAPRLLLVAPSLDFHPSSEIVLSYLSPEIEVVRIGVAANWREKLQVMFRLCGASRPD